MTAPRPILYLAPSGQVGGAERCLLSLIAGLDPAEFPARVLIGSPGPLSSLLTQAQVEAQVVPLPAALRRLSRYHANPGLAARSAPAWQLPAYLYRLKRAGASGRPSLVHSNGMKMHYLSALLQPSWGVPLVWHLHDFPARQRSGNEPWSNRLLDRLATRPRLVIANSQAVADAFAARLPRLAGKLRVIPNGVNVDAMQAAATPDQAARLRQCWGFSRNDFLIGMVATFAPWKGQEIFLQAARQVHQLRPDVRFVLVGDDIYDTTGHGGQRQQLETLTRSLGLSAVVRFAGFLNSEIPSAYAALDVMVHASTQPEPFGRTAIEAMAAGTPVIAAAAGGMLEIVEDARSGRLTPPGDVDALAAAMLQLHADSALRTRLAQAGLERVRTHFSEAIVARALAAVYHEILEDAAP